MRILILLLVMVSSVTFSKEKFKFGKEEKALLLKLSDSVLYDPSETEVFRNCRDHVQREMVLGKTTAIVAIEIDAIATKNPTLSNRYCSALAYYWAESYAVSINMLYGLVGDDYPNAYPLLVAVLMLNKTEMQDKKAIFEYSFKGARHGNILSLWAVADSVINGFGVRRDIDFGIKLHEKLVRARSAESAFSLFTLYYHGKSVKKNTNLANKWLIEAADLGDANSQHILASYYMYGDRPGIQKDLDKALIYASRSAQQQWPAAKGMVGYLMIVGKEDNLYRGYRLIKEAEIARPEESRKILRYLHCFDLSDSAKLNLCVHHKPFSHHKYQLSLADDSEQPLFRLIDDTVENINIESKAGKLTGGCKPISGKSDDVPVELGQDCEFFLDGKPFGKKYSWNWKELE